MIEKHFAYFFNDDGSKDWLVIVPDINEEFYLKVPKPDIELLKAMAAEECEQYIYIVSPEGSSGWTRPVDENQILGYRFGCALECDLERAARHVKVVKEFEIT